MPVFECRGCPGAICNLFIQDDDCAEPAACPWGGDNRPVWRRLGVKE
jgi:hypothetical protein